MAGIIKVTPLNAVDGTTAQTSAAIPIPRIQRISASVIMTGSTTPIAGVKIQYSNDVAPNGMPIASFVPTNWTDLPNGSCSITGDGAVAIPSIDLCYEYLQVVYAISGGTGGTLTVKMRGAGWP